MSLRERIIHEALRLFSLKGYLSTSIEDILAAASGSKGGLYNHFKSKDELFLAVLAEARRIWQGKVLTGLRETPGGLDRIRLFLSNYRDSYLKDSKNIPGGCVFVTLSVELDDQRPELAAEVRKGFAGVKRILEEILEEAKEGGELVPGVDTKGLSEMLFSGMIGASVLYGMDRADSTLDAALNPLLEYLDKIAVPTS